MATVYVNNKPVNIGNERLNCIQAAEKGGVFIPHYCWHPALSVVASCRMCLVEVGEMKDGKPAMQPKVVPACQTPAKEGTVIITNSEKAKQAQGQTLESLLLNHPLDCPVCDKAGECMLQDFSYRFGKSESRMIDEKNTPPNKPQISDKITLFTDRCIMCSRCVRFTREIAGTAELQIVNRGHHAEIEVFPGQPLENKLASNVVDLCPVGALCSRDFLYKQRVWYLKEQKSVCPDCSTGCSIDVDSNKNIVYRLRPRANPQAQGWFMCDEGRFGFHYVNSTERFRQPMIHSPDRISQSTWVVDPPKVQIQYGRFFAAPWITVLNALHRRFAEVATQDAAAVVGLLSPFLTCEEAFLLAKYLKGLTSQVVLALGPVPVVGTDDTFPKNAKGEPVQPVKFTIRAEKCPNRRGVEEVLRHFQGEIVGFDQVVRDAGQGRFKAVYFAGGYPPRKGGWITKEQAAALAKASLLVVHDLLPSPLSEVATHILPAAAWVEKDGTFVNHAGLAQAIRRAVTPAGEFRSDGQVFLDLLERRGLFHAATLRKELASQVAYFAPLASGDLGEFGIKLDSDRVS
jgi:NADH-quinone oxidoreductase subunit G